MILGDARRRQAVEAARAIDTLRGITRQNERWSAHWFGAVSNSYPLLHLDDVSGIPFLKDILGVELYQLRARIRAQTGDLYTATCPAMPDYDTYNGDVLGLGSATFVQAPAHGNPIEVAVACQSGRALDEVEAAAKTSGGLVIHPYMGIESVWVLAEKIAQRANVPVTVMAPPPTTTWYANDKCDLTTLATHLLGADSVVESHISAEPAKLAESLKVLAKSHRQVALKMARCASAMGNRIYPAAELAPLTPPQVESLVRACLIEKEWQPGEPVVACAWEAAEASPSTQLWIPPAGAGEPSVDGVYEQLLEGPECVFLGSVPSRLGPEVDRYLSLQSLAIATAYQQLGYVGRCSFDFIQVGNRLMFTECNGRWGGTSTPMHLMDRVFPGGRPFYRAQDYVCEDYIGRTFTDLANALGDSLYDPRTGEGCYILYNLGCLPGVGKFDVITLGPDLDTVGELIEHDLPSRLARG